MVVAKKSLGQNFLIDGNYQRKIIQSVLELKPHTLLKTAIGQILQKGDMDTSNPSTNPEVIDLIASFQWEAIEAIIDKIELTLQNNRVNAVVVSGGVACNSYLRQRVKELSESLGIKYLIPPPVLCTDNGAMIAYVGAQQLLRGQKSNWDANAHASKPLF